MRGEHKVREGNDNREGVLYSMRQKGCGLTSAELALRTGLCRRTVLKYLRGFIKDTKVTKQKTRHGVVIYWLLKQA